MRLTNLVTLFALGCTSDYGLNPQKDGGITPEDVNIPQYDVDELKDDNPTVSYDPCDPNGQGWEVHPEGTERNGCYGLLGSFDEIDGYGSCTKIYFGDCFDEFSTLYPKTTLRDNSNHWSNVDYTVSCGDEKRILYACFDLIPTDENESASIEADIYLFSSEDQEMFDSTGLSDSPIEMNGYLEDNVAQALHLTLYRSASGSTLVDLTK